MPTYDLDFQDYSRMANLARAGFDVFALDLTGYRLSPQPRMDDPGNTNPPHQLFVPDPLPAACLLNYPFRPATPFRSRGSFMSR